jgi:hypothetical protein
MSKPIIHKGEIWDEFKIDSSKFSFSKYYEGEQTLIRPALEQK